MVIWEVLSGQVPFSRCDIYAVVAKVSAPHDLKARGACGSRMVSGVCWNVVGHRDRATALGLGMHSGAWGKFQDF